MTTVARIGLLKGPLTIRCFTCAHQVTWSVAEAIRRFGGECMVTDARRRLACSACGERRSRCVDFV